MSGEKVWKVRSTPSPDEILRTMNEELRPLLRLAITMPSKACERLRSPSTTLTLTITVSPGEKSGTDFFRRWISSCSSFWIKFMFRSCAPAGIPPAGAQERNMNLIQKLEQEEIQRLKKSVPDFSPGDTVIVNVNVVEGERKRSQAFEGMVIAKRNKGLNSSFIVRKISSGEGVERTFQTFSPLIASIEVKRKGDVRRAKLYYLRARSGKSARIRERTGGGEGESQE